VGHLPTLVAIGFLLAEGKEVLGAFDGLADTAEQGLEVFAVLDEIDFGGVDDEQVAGRIVEEKVFVGFDDLFHVLVADGALVGDILAPEALAENIERGLEVDDEIGGGQLGAEEFVITVVDGKLVVAEVEVGEEFVLLEDVVGDDYLLRIVGGGEGAELLEAADEKGKLSLESGSGLAIIEGGEKWVRLGLLNKLAVELLGKETGERALADANRTFYGDISGWFEKISHGGWSGTAFLSGSKEAYRGVRGGSNRVDGRK
jgi:hypothetical protein